MTTDRPETREVITKAVCGRGAYKYDRSIDLELPVGHRTIQVLGNYISNAGLDDSTVVDRFGTGKAVQVKGHYDVHVWYAFGQDTCAAKTTVTFIEYIPIKMYGGESISSPQAFAEITQKPRCRKAHVKNLNEKTVIRVEIEQLLAAEVVGLTKLKLGVIPGSLKDDSVVGRELLPPQCGKDSYCIPHYNCSLDLKCEEDLPEEDDDYDFAHDEY